LNGESVISIEGLTKRFGGRTVVDTVSLDVRPGEIVGFLGPNGSGKTTTIRMICGLLVPDEGSGTCLGHDILTESDLIKLEVGYMTQRFSLYEDLTIRENLDFVARLYDLRPRAQFVDETLERLGLVNRRNQLAGTLSGGWKQRLALAACIMHRPKLLLLDEPTAGVDPKARREFWDEIHALAAEGLTVLVSTHYMDEAERCHRIIYISYGKIVARGTVPQVIAQSGLSMLVVTGGGLAEIARRLKDAGRRASGILRHRSARCRIRPARTPRGGRCGRRRDTGERARTGDRSRRRVHCSDGRGDRQFRR
jgi:ABC-2 type transport system ATP-binding protein